MLFRWGAKILCQEFKACENKRPHNKIEHKKSVPHLPAGALIAA
jgi:hypothetical protein